MKSNCVLCSTNPIKHAQSSLCGACYQFLYYWKQRSVTRMMDYVHRLGARRERMERLLNKHGNVKMISKRK